MCRLPLRGISSLVLSCSSMTRENRLILTLDDIRALRWTCGVCGASVSFALDRTIRLPRQCPACHEETPPDVGAEALHEVMTCLQSGARIARDKKGPRATLSFEFVEP